MGDELYTRVGRRLTYYPDLETVLSAAIESAEKESQWSAGFKSRVQGEPLLKTAHPDFKEGWEEARKAEYGEEMPDVA